MTPRATTQKAAPETIPEWTTSWVAISARLSAALRKPSLNEGDRRMLSEALVLAQAHVRGLAGPVTGEGPKTAGRVLASIVKDLQNAMGETFQYNLRERAAQASSRKQTETPPPPPHGASPSVGKIWLSVVGLLDVEHAAHLADDHPNKEGIRSSMAEMAKPYRVALGKSLLQRVTPIEGEDGPMNPVGANAMLRVPVKSMQSLAARVLEPSGAEMQEDRSIVPMKGVTLEDLIAKRPTRATKRK